MQALGNAISLLLERGYVEEAEILGDEKEAPVEAMMAIALFYQKHKYWQRAFKWHNKIYNKDTFLKDVAFGNMVTCLLEVGNVKKAEKLTFKKKTAVEGFIALSNYYYEKANWQAALKWSNLIASHSKKYQDFASQRKLDCFRNMDNSVSDEELHSFADCKNINELGLF